MQPIVIDTNNFIRGESKTRNSNDGGFSPLTKNINLIKTKTDGALHGTPSASSLGVGTMVKEIVAGTVDPAFLGNDAYMVDASGNFYKLSAGTLTKSQTDATNTYQLGTTDIKVFMGEIFATSQGDIAKLTSGLAALDHDWWTNTRSHSALQTSYRHPMEEVEGVLFIADEYRIHTWDGTTSVASAMSLPTDVNITSLRKHPDGRHLIAFCGTTANFSHIRGSGGKVFIIDTVNLEWIQEVRVEGQVEGSRVVGGVVYVTYGTNFGYFNGSGLVWLRNLTSATTYSHSITALEDVIVIRDSDELICYGDVGAGRVFWNLADTSFSLTAILAITPKKILYSYLTGGGTGVLNQIDLDGTENGAQIVTNPISGGVRLWIRRVDVEQDNVSSYVATRFRYYQPDGNLNEFAYIEQNIGATSQVPRHYRVNTNVLGDNYSIQVQQESNFSPIYKITIYVEAYE